MSLTYVSDDDPFGLHESTVYDLATLLIDEGMAVFLYLKFVIDHLDKNSSDSTSPKLRWIFYFFEPIPYLAEVYLLLATLNGSI